MNILQTFGEVRDELLQKYKGSPFDSFDISKFFETGSPLEKLDDLICNEVRLSYPDENVHYNYDRFKRHIVINNGDWQNLQVIMSVGIKRKKLDNGVFVLDDIYFEGVQLSDTIDTVVYKGLDIAKKLYDESDAMADEAIKRLQEHNLTYDELFKLAKDLYHIPHQAIHIIHQKESNRTSE